MVRKKNAPHEPDSRVPAAKPKDDFLAALLAQRDQIDAEALTQPDLFKPALLNVVSGLDTLADAIRTEAGKRSDG